MACKAAAMVQLILGAVCLFPMSWMSSFVCCHSGQAIADIFCKIFQFWGMQHLGAGCRCLQDYCGVAVQCGALAEGFRISPSGLFEEP